MHVIIGSASYIVHEVRSVRERDTERDGSDVTIVALKLAMSFALFLAKNLHLSIGEEFLHFSLPKICILVSLLLNGAEFTLSVAKNVALFETVRILRKIRTVKWRDRGSKQQKIKKNKKKQSNFRLHRPSHQKTESN